MNYEPTSMIKYLNKPAQQQGIATILIILLVGVAMTVTSLGVVYSVKSTQQKHVASQAATQTQAAAWAGAEVMRLYLEQLGSAQAVSNALVTTNDMVITIPNSGVGSGVDVVANATSAPVAPGDTLIPITITAKDPQAQASAILEVTYKMPTSSAGNTPSTPSCNAPLVFNDNTIFENGQQSVADGAKPLSISVKGDLTIPSGATIQTGFDEIRVTGNVTVGAHINIESIQTNGDINLSGEAVVNFARAMGDINIGHANGPANVFDGIANGDVVLDGGNTDRMFALGVSAPGNILVNSANAATVNQNDQVSATDTAGRGALMAPDNVHDRLYAKGDVTITGGRVDLVQAEGSVSGIDNNVNTVITASDLTCPGGWLGTVGIFTGATGSAPSFTDCKLLKTNIAQALPAPVTEVDIPIPQFDAYSSEVMNDMNYLFRYDPSSARIEVTVQNVNQLAEDGSPETYFLASFSEADMPAALTVSNGIKRMGFHDYLCQEASGAGGSCTCTRTQGNSCITPPATICWQGVTFGGDSACVTYDLASSTWNLKGWSLLPGHYWFEGDVNIALQHSYSTIVATGNIVSGRGEYGDVNAAIEAVNYAGPGPVCSAQLNNPETANVTNYAGDTIFQRVFDVLRDKSDLLTALGYVDATPNNPADDNDYIHNDFVGFYPTKTCDATFTPSSIGNNALAAGGIKNGTFSGGDIDLKVNNNIYGSVLAGNTISGGQDTKVFGYVSAYGLNDSGRQENSFTNSLQLFSPPDGQAPYFGDDSCSGTPTTTTPTGTTPAAGGAGSAFTVRMLWSRYL